MEYFQIKKMMEIEGKEQELKVVDNPLIVSTSSMNLKETLDSENYLSTRRRNSDPEKISIQTTQGCSSKGCSSTTKNQIILNNQTIFYGPSTFSHKDLKLKLITLKEEHESFKTNECLFQVKENAHFLNLWKKQIHKIHENIQYCLINFGLGYAHQVTQIHMEKSKIDNTADWDTENEYLTEALKIIKDAYLTEVLKILEDAFPSDMKNCGSMEEGNLFGVQKGLFTPKIHALMRCLLSREYKDMHCVITTKSMLEAIAISRFLKVFHYSEYKDGSTHINGFKMKQSSPKGFGFSKVDILLTTQDIDVERYNYTIYYDFPNTICSEGSYIVFLERGNKEQRDLFYDLIENDYLAWKRSSIPSTLQRGSQKDSVSDGRRMTFNPNYNIDQNEELFSEEMDREIEQLYDDLNVKEDEGVLNYGKSLEENFARDKLFLTKMSTQPKSPYYCSNSKEDDFVKNCGKSVDDKVFSQELPPTKMTTQREGLHSCSNFKEDKGVMNYGKSLEENIVSDKMSAQPKSLYSSSNSKEDEGVMNYGKGLEENFASDLTKMGTQPKSLYSCSNSKEVCTSLGMSKGVPRSQLEALSRKMKWSKPRYNLFKKDGMNHKPKFVYKVELQLSEKKLPVTVTGEEKTHANEAKDSAAFLMLKELEKYGLYKSR